MSLAQVIDGQATEIASPTVTHGDVQSSIATLLMWSEAERNAAGVYTIAEADVPPRHDVTSSRLVFDGSTVRRVVTTQPIPVRPYAVIIERDRRLSLGFDYNFGDVRGTHRIGTTPNDMIGWDEVTKATQALVAVGRETTPLTIVTDTGPATITAREWQDILVAAAVFRQPIWAASFALQAMSPIPEDFAADAYWG